MFNQINNVLVLAPHPDDAEFGLGGTITKLLEMDKEIHIAVFSNCEKSTPPGFEKGTIVKELYESCKSLGIKQEFIHLMDFSVRDFPAHRQEILETLIKLRNSLKPDLVFVPCSSDIHQDHQTIHNEGVRAFKYACLLGYEMPWNNFAYTSYVYVSLEKRHLEKKLAALALYETQKNRSYSSAEFVKSLAILRGGQIKKQFAESFELLRFLHH